MMNEQIFKINNQLRGTLMTLYIYFRNLWKRSWNMLRMRHLAFCASISSISWNCRSIGPWRIPRSISRSMQINLPCYNYRIVTCFTSQLHQKRHLSRVRIFPCESLLESKETNRPERSIKLLDFFLLTCWKSAKDPPKWARGRSRFRRLGRLENGR